MKTFRSTRPMRGLALGAALILGGATGAGAQTSAPPAGAGAPSAPQSATQSGATQPGASQPGAATPAGATSPGATLAGGTGPFVFGSPPSAQANRIYSVNVRTGEVSACQFERPEGSVVGVTKCFPRDASAAAGPAGTYDMVTTRYSGETGIFRVNAQTGEMSVCYVRDMPKEGGGTEPAVVCTAPAR